MKSCVKLHVVLTGMFSLLFKQMISMNNLQDFQAALRKHKAANEQALAASEKILQQYRRKNEYDEDDIPFAKLEMDAKDKPFPLALQEFKKQNDRATSLHEAHIARLKEQWLQQSTKQNSASSFQFASDMSKHSKKLSTCSYLNPYIVAVGNKE